MKLLQITTALIVYNKVLWIVNTNWDSFFITKCDTDYYKLRQVFQSAMVLSQKPMIITNCDGPASVPSFNYTSLQLLRTFCSSFSTMAFLRKFLCVYKQWYQQSIASVFKSENVHMVILRLNWHYIHDDEQIWPNKLNHLYFHFVILKLGSDTETKKDQLRHF